MGYLRREKVMAFAAFNPAKIKKWTTDKKNITNVLCDNLISELLL